MGKIYIGQTALRITLNCGVNISNSDAKIKVKKPGEDIIIWDASIEDAEQGKIYYDVEDNDLNVSGIWSLWAYIIFNNGKVAPGEVVYLNVFTEGQ